MQIEDLDLGRNRNQLWEMKVREDLLEEVALLGWRTEG